jgi:hypothetical protein
MGWLMMVSGVMLHVSVFDAEFAHEQEVSGCTTGAHQPSPDSPRSALVKHKHNPALVILLPEVFLMVMVMSMVSSGATIDREKVHEVTLKSATVSLLP